MKKGQTRPRPANLPRHERHWYDNTGLSMPCAHGLCGGCQHPTCTHMCERHGHQPRDAGR
ncbi:hypothetical protein ABZ897_15695 [Nonomuraea sp. NPDC046802]|uniref:hypothetical protein n=1 Tax=Nonomuraea sp. NPDC046802 TaxID=3154919 RepID=UPI0033C87A01